MSVGKTELANIIAEAVLENYPEGLVLFRCTTAIYFYFIALCVEPAGAAYRLNNISNDFFLFDRGAEFSNNDLPVADYHSRITKKCGELIVR